MSFYLAVDIGASSGRHILGSVQDGKLILEEVYRFENNIVKENGSVLWDIDALFEEVVNGIRRCGEIGKIPKTIAIDTWGVDYVLLDSDKKEIMPVYSYRDGRTAQAVKEVEKIIPPGELYAKTGIQKQPFNTIYQLYCDKISGRLKNAAHFLMIPEYLAFKLTGVMKNEYTNATTTGLVNAQERTWDKEILEKLGIPERIFNPLTPPASLLGELKEEIADKVGFNASFIMCPTHDTASAVAACPIFDGGMYISSGTWSLAGVENSSPVLSEEARMSNFTNEGGAEYKYRFLKNIMGMWIFQNIRRECGKRYSYDEMMHMAEESNFEETIDVNSPSLTAPDSMTDAIRALLGKPQLPLKDVLSCAYRSLALSYKNTADEIEKLTGRKISSIQIIGGGGTDKYLNRLTASVTGRKVYTGLKEATATGNIMSQYIYDTPGASLENCRKIIKNSFEIKEI